MAFNTNPGRFTLKLKEKLALIIKFINDFKVTLSGAYESTIGGCSSSNIDGEIKIIFFF